MRDQHALEEPLCFSSVTALARGIQHRDVSSEQVVVACVERLQNVNPSLNAVVQLQAGNALRRAREADAALARGETWGPLHGVPMTIKDSFDTAGVVSTGGTLGRASYVPTRNATVVERLLDSGAILLGKTNTPELTLSFETSNLIYGRTNNPYDLERTPGGSSGGAAAAVAAGGTPFDIGSDYAGSIRLPAHFCGIAGIKPTAGRVSRAGHVFPSGGVQDGFQQIGPLARYVDDLMLLLPLIMGPDWIDPGVVPMPYGDPRQVELKTLRVAFHTDNGIRAVDPGIKLAVEAVARALEPEVAIVDDERPSETERTMQIGFGLPAWDGGAGVRRLLEAAGTSEHTLQRFTERRPLDAEQTDRLVTDWCAWKSRMLSFMRGYDVIVCPVNASTALLHGATESPDALTAFSYTMTYNAAGWPGAVVRVATAEDGLPIGVQIVAAPAREDIALAVAKFVESNFLGYQRPAL